MKFPEQYTQRAKLGEEFTLHSGDKSGVKYDVNSLLMDDGWFREVIKNIIYSPHYVGIPTGGALIAREASRQHNTLCSMIKDDEIKGKIPRGPFLLVDDVTTTERSLIEALKILQKYNVEISLGGIYVVMDRRPKDKRRLDITAMFSES
jgi:orotate phosphoribosyltransferase